MKERFSFPMLGLTKQVAKDYAVDATQAEIIADDGRLRVVDGKVDLSPVGPAFTRYRAVDPEEVGLLLISVNLHVLNQGYQAWCRLAHRLVAAEGRHVLRS